MSVFRRRIMATWRDSLTSFKGFKLIASNEIPTTYTLTENKEEFGTVPTVKVNYGDKFLIVASVTYTSDGEGDFRDNISNALARGIYASTDAETTFSGVAERVSTSSKSMSKVFNIRTASSNSFTSVAITVNYIRVYKLQDCDAMADDIVVLPEESPSYQYWALFKGESYGNVVTGYQTPPDGTPIWVYVTSKTTKSFSASAGHWKLGSNYDFYKHYISTDGIHWDLVSENYASATIDTGMRTVYENKKYIIPTYIANNGLCPILSN